MGVPESLADRMATLLLTRAALDIADLAYRFGRSVLDTARVYSAFNERLGLFWLHVGAEDLKVKGRWQAQARGNLRDEFYRIRRDFACSLLEGSGDADVTELVDNWLKDRETKVERFKSMLSEMRLRNAVDLASLSVAAQELRDLIND
jgi:glutamate dehydrogenase